jgi:hypothetical protein
MNDEELPTFVGTQTVITADRIGRTVDGMNCFRQLNHGGPGFESHSGYGCLSAFILFSFCPV